MWRPPSLRGTSFSYVEHPVMWQALLLCAAHDFDAGIVYLYERSHQPVQLLRHHFKRHDADQVLSSWPCESPLFAHSRLLIAARGPHR